MSAYVDFTKYFDRYSPSSRAKEELERAEFLKAEADREKRRIVVRLKSDGAFESAGEIESELSGLYGCEVKLNVELAEAGRAETICWPQATEYVEKKCPAAKFFLHDSSFSAEGGVVTVLLAHGGAELLCEMGAKEAFLEYFETASQAVGRIVFGGVLEAVKDEKQHEKELFAAPVKKSGGRPLNKNDVAPGDRYFDEESYSEIVFGKSFGGRLKLIPEIAAGETVATRGAVFKIDSSETWDKSRKRLTFFITDHNGAVAIKLLAGLELADRLEAAISVGDAIKVRGETMHDKYLDDIIIQPASIVKIGRAVRRDEAAEKRCELHLHTNMSAMDAVTDVSDYIKRAKVWGMPAVAITDHGVVQAFPDAASAAKKCGYEGKVIYGLEAYFVNDCQKVLHGEDGRDIDGEFVVFDVECTGLDPKKEALTEIGAVRVKNREIVDSFHTFVDPGRPISPRITELTGITSEMVAGAPGPAAAAGSFLKFCGDAVLVAHNASFDMSFITAADAVAAERAYIDTVLLSRLLYKGLKNYKLNTVAEHLGLGGFNHHRADADAGVTARMFVKMLDKLSAEHGIKTVAEINRAAAGNVDIKRAKSYHQIILVKNEQGRRNLYSLVSSSHLNHFFKNPRIPRSELEKRREGLIIGSACEAGELFSAIVEGKSWAELINIAEFYDFLEIQPICNNRFLIERGVAGSDDDLREYNRTVVKLGEKLSKPVVATGDVHFLDPEDEIYRHVLLAAMKFSDADKSLPLYLKTTDEMLGEFSYLGREKAYEVVIKNPQLIADMCEKVSPVPGGELCAPKIDGCEEELERISRERAAEIYGSPLPEIVEKRLERELKSIIGNGFAVMYITAQRLVKKSNSDGYLVGSRGSVGSSFVAFLSGITEVNSLAPHYCCEHCKHSEFNLSGEYEAGCDMPDKDCPNCKKPMKKDGFEIPFETFLGFDGDKTPDIDLNFSGDYQAKAHKYTEELFGEGHTFKAGTIGTVAERTAFGFARKYMEERGFYPRAAECTRLAAGCEGVKRTTGQHPGGIIVVPSDMDINEFTPVQRPADKQDVDVITTHFDYHKIDNKLLKLDILGHDDPTVIRMLEDLTGVKVGEISLDDESVMRIFSENPFENCAGDEILTAVGAAAIPEFGTRFVRQMLIDTRPTTFAELVRISGLSHGTDVWVGNAKNLVTEGVTNLRGAICCRDDIMNYLILRGLESKMAFSIMEAVRKGKGLRHEWETAMRDHEVPDWYIDSCKKIKYMFPKAHAVAYVTSAFRIAWFKVHRPKEFYAAYFSIRADDFDAQLMTGGLEKTLKEYRRLAAAENATAKAEGSLGILEIVYEFNKRGFTFDKIDIYKSDATRFLVTENGLLPPLNAVNGLGAAAAHSVVEARGKGKFLSEEDLLDNTKLNKTHVELLRALGALGDMPETAQVSLF